eukprot:TRINITY_DN8747_c0_g2_i1.p1 TRINITY_DN8747_c0_g2~~TRINITY_DN8747_c0_g2_i1.p1  ORF type:complete len:201 (+),score=31.58 TRINITY_DN8747_c0_g2_i1:66-668(+)
MDATKTNFLAGFVSGAISMLLFVVLIICIKALITRINEKRRKKRRYHPNAEDSEMEYMGESQRQGGVYVIEGDSDEEDNFGETVDYPQITLDINVTEVEPTEFQEKWSEAPLCGSFDTVISRDSDLETFMAAQKIYCLAHGTVNNSTKYYFYASQGEIFYMMEIIVSLETYDLTARVKCQNARLGNAFVEHLKDVLSACK